MTCEPLVHLLQVRRQRGAQLPSWGLVLVIYGLPALACHFFLGESGAAFVGTVTIGLLAVLPLYFFKSEVSLVSSLRKGRCLEEMISAGLAPPALVDTLAFSSLRPMLQVCLKVMPILLLGAWAAPEDLGLPLLEMILIWPFLLAFFFVYGSYLYQARTLTPSPWGASSLKVGLVFTLTLFDLLVLVQQPLVGGLLLLLLVPLTVVACREVAVDGLSNPVRLEQTASGPLSQLGKRNRWVPVWSDNLIVARELTRRAGLPGGLHGYVAVRMLAILLPLLWGLYLCTDLRDCQGRFWMGLPVIALLYFLRSAMRTLGAVVHERGQKTWEPLVQTGVGFAEFRSGWLQLATLPYLLDSLPTLFVVLLLSLFVPLTEAFPSPLTAVLLCAALAWLCRVGAYVGLALSATHRTVQEAAGSLLRLVLMAGAGWLALWGAVYFVSLRIYEDGLSFADFRSWMDVSTRLLPSLSAVLVAWGMQGWARRKLAAGLEVCDLQVRPTGIERAWLARPCLVGGLLGATAAIWELHSAHRFRVYRVDWTEALFLGLVCGLVVWRYFPGLTSPGLRHLAALLAGLAAAVATPLFFLSLGLMAFLPISEMLKSTCAPAFLVSGVWCLLELLVLERLLSK